MNKRILNILLSIFIFFVLIIGIGADGNINDLNDSTKEIVYENLDKNLDLNNFEGELILQEEENISVETSENSSDDPLSLNKTDYSIDLEESNSTNIIPITSTDLSSSTNNEDLEIIKESIDSSSSGSKEEYYIDSLELNNDSVLDNSNIKFSDSSNEVNEDICLIQDLGERVIEIKNCEEGDLEKISREVTIQRLEKNEFEKEVIFSSSEHFEKPFVFYIPLTTEVKKEEIKIYWKNQENLEITGLEEFSVEYYDENENGLIDKVSWVIPHLSEQIFKIIVNVSNVSESEEELLLEVLGPEGKVANPINFQIKVNYSGNFSCNLEIGGNSAYSFSSNKNYSLNLPNGDYNWSISCFDTLNGKYNITLGNFSVNENFACSLQDGKLYFLDLIENKIKNPETVIINSTNPSAISIKITRNGQTIYTQNAFNTTTLVMNEAILNASGNYAMSVKFDEPSPQNEILKNFSVASANLILNTTSAKEGDPVKITVLVNSPSKTINTIILAYGDGASNYSLASTNSFSQDFVKKYIQDGTYSLSLSATIDTTYTIQKNGIVVTNPPNLGDDDAPSINLLQPQDEKVFYTDIINFSYKANDNVKIQNCTFKLYEGCASMKYCSTSDSNLVFPLNSQQKALANNYSVQNNKEVRIDLKDFDDGIYQWIVECYDNSSNYDWEIGFFEVDMNSSEAYSAQNYTKKNEIEALKEQADSFLTQSFNLEEKEVLDDLNILNDTKYYKKRLLDIDNFFKENYKYVSSEELREKKTEEYLEELENIKNRIPQSISINEKYEYIKNSIESDFEEITQAYFDSTNTQISKSSLKKLAEVNRNLQNLVSVSTKVKDIEIEYNNGTQNLILVKKKITLNDDSYTRILEIIPKDVAEDSEGVVFFVENKVIEEDPIFEIDYDDLETQEIIYYLTEKVKLKEIEKTDTILFEDNLNKFEAGVTGLFVLNFASKDTTLYIIAAFVLLIVLIIIVPLVFKKFKLMGWRREPNVVKVMNLITDIERALKEKDIESAREKYYKIKEIYPVLPQKTKAYFYEKINEMLIRIDRKDIFGLVKEYQEAKRKWNKEDVMRLYEDIKKIYERLPEKDRRNVYNIINGY